MSTNLPFKKKLPIGIITPGQVIINGDGTVVAQDFHFNGVNLKQAEGLAISWAIEQLMRLEPKQ